MNKIFSLALVVVVGAFTACETKPHSMRDQPDPTPVTTTGAPKADPTPEPVKPAPVEVAEKPADAAPASAAATEAKSLFQTRCIVCHGANGHGDGAAAAALKPPPRDYTDGEWQKSVTDDYLAKVILQGGQAVGKSPLMPGNADLEKKPAVVAELVKIIRAFAK